jgi:AraC-like DNA-binding protein
MDPTFRRWWRLIDDLPGKLSQVLLWKDGPPPPLTGDGHLHVTPTSVVCLEGVVRIVAPNRMVDLQPGQALIIGAGVWHRHEALRRGSIWFGQGFLPACSDVLMGDQDREWRGRLPSQPSRRLMDATLAAPDDKTRSASFTELVKQILSESVDDLPFTNAALQRMISRLWSNLHRGVTVEDLIRASGLSRAQAYRIFTEGYGVPPKDAIATARLWLAEGLLANGLTVAAVADRCGFPSADTFARAWKRLHGAPPSQARK